MTEVRRQFEEWWSTKSRSMFPAELKELYWLAFADGWHRRDRFKGIG